jgi:hypothetical protein
MEVVHFNQRQLATRWAISEATLERDFDQDRHPSCPSRRTMTAHPRPAMTGPGGSPWRWAASPAAVADGVPTFRLTIYFDE